MMSSVWCAPSSFHPPSADMHRSSRTMAHRSPTTGRVSPCDPVFEFSKEIRLGDKSGVSLAFVQDVCISGWTSMGISLAACT